MKKLILSIILLSGTNAFAYGINLNQEGMMTVGKLVELEAEYVQCNNPKPKCIFSGIQYGIQYPGQSIEEVSLTLGVSVTDVFKKLKDLKESGFCE